MTRKTDSPNTRRNHFLYRASKETPQKLGVSLPWDIAARQALTLEKTVFNGVPVVHDISFDALTRAFAHFKLDPQDPSDWRHLINMLAYMQFGERPKKARHDPKKWTSAKTEELRTEIKPLGRLSNKRTALRLTKDKKSTFFGFGAAGLEKRIAEIRRAE